MNLSRGLKFGNSDVLGSCRLGVDKSINAYLSESDTCESVIMSLPLIFSGGWSRFCLHSSLS